MLTVGNQGNCGTLRRFKYPPSIVKRRPEHAPQLCGMPLDHCSRRYIQFASYILYIFKMGKQMKSSNTSDRASDTDRTFVCCRYTAHSERWILRVGSTFVNGAGMKLFGAEKYGQGSLSLDTHDSEFSVAVHCRLQQLVCIGGICIGVRHSSYHSWSKIIRVQLKQASYPSRRGPSSAPYV